MSVRKQKDSTEEEKREEQGGLAEKGPETPRKSMDKLQGLQKKNLSVEEYWQKIVLYIKRAGINEDNHTTISRFLSGLKLEIRNKVELLPYRDLNDFIQLNIKVEKQILRKQSSQKQSSYSVSYDKDEFRRGE